MIPTPFELLIEMILWFTESNPVIGANTSTLEIDWLGAVGISDASSTTSPVVGFNTIKFGAVT